MGSRPKLGSARFSSFGLCYKESIMPGHIKLVKGAVDPDPTEYLLPSLDMKREDQAKVYDTKKSVWIMDAKTHAYKEGLLESGDIATLGAEGADLSVKMTVAVAHEKFTLKAGEIGRVNPPKFEKCEDMVNLTFLNDASVFWNLKTRYQAKMIHTYSGLFVVVVNPYKRYPLYTHRMCKIYLGKRRNEVPPHLWAIAEGAYRNMLQNKKDNAMLITGESGAGKTENTKKVITYLAMVAAGGGKKSEKKVSLEDQIVATNPILESYGNAKTARNDNSSRFGKFIRIHFSGAGKLAGCDIVSYLLEKSRITEQQEDERSYHIFYQLLQTFHPEMQAKCLCSTDAYDYCYISQGKTTVASIDDNEECEYTLDAFNVIGFSELETWSCLQITAGVMSCGEVVYATKGRDDQAENENTKEGDIPWKVATLWGVDAVKMIKAFCKPRIKVGTEWVTKGQTCEQAASATGGVARAIFDRLFKWLIEKCNDTLIDHSMKKANFCAVLDIAGFEIFEYNGFEQISINFVNEKLQQFFNHHMFVVEQEEYVKEGIDWVMVDFGMDLAAAIIMFEKPMGLWAILEEESLFPKATDKSFEEKLKTSLGKLPNFLKPQSKTDKNAHFAISHYAGIVSYNVTTAQVELNKKRESEVNKLRKDVEEANIQQESILSNLKRKQGDATAEMTEQIDALGKMKSKIEKDKVLIMNEIADARAATDEVMRAQASSDMSNKKMLENLNAINKKVDNANLTLGDACDLGLALEHAIAGNAETQTTIKKYALQVRDAQMKVDEESACKSAAADAKVTADRRAAAVANGLEEARALLETADRQRRAAEQELADTNETLADMTNVNQSITASKRKLEGELGQLNSDLDEMTNEASLSEDKAARAMVDAARLADELRCEQELAMNLEKDKKLLEAQCKDAATRADEAEVNALKGGRKAIIKMETRIRELESELDAETRRFGDVTKNLRKSERSIKELAFAADEDRKNHERMQSLIDQLQGKVKSYKKQIEEAQEIAALNLAKYRKVAGALGDAEASADANEQAMAMRKARAKSASLGL